MREDDAVTKEVSRGKEVHFVGMTRNGSKVYFTSGEKLLPEDKDTSEDLYLWEAEGDTLTLVSQERHARKRRRMQRVVDRKMRSEAAHPMHFQASEFFDRHAHVPGIDDVLSSDSGDIYFYSPEDLVAGQIGGNGQRNCTCSAMATCSSSRPSNRARKSNARPSPKTAATPRS